MWVDYEAKRNVLVSTKGHDFDRESFYQMFDAITADADGLTWTHVEQPATDRFLSPEGARDYAALIFYDLPGLYQTGPHSLRELVPDQQWQDNFEALLEAGKPLIFLHHAICGWPAYPRYAEVMGGRYLFTPLTLDGERHIDSGYVHDVRHHVAPVVEHPVTAGLEDGFDLEGELYLYEVFDDVLPLMRCSDYTFTREHFFSSAEALNGRIHSRENWPHPPSSDLIAWARREKNSPIVYIQTGHDANAFDHPAFRRLLTNAIDWATSDAAKEWVGTP